MLPGTPNICVNKGHDSAVCELAIFLVKKTVSFAFNFEPFIRFPDLFRAAFMHQLAFRWF